MSVEVTAAMSANVWKILVKVGDEVKEDDELLILEAIKMEIPVYSPVAGKVSAIKVAEGTQVDGEQVLMVID